MPATKKTSKSAKASSSKSPKRASRSTLFANHNASPKALLLFVAVIAGLIGGSMWWMSTRAAGAGSIVLSPGSVKVASGNNFQVEVWADSGTEQMNVVQAQLGYPADKLEFVSATAGTALPNTAEAKGSNGLVQLAYYTDPNTSTVGRQLVATVTFKALVNKGSATVGFTGESLIVKTSDATNMLSSTSGTSVSFGATKGGGKNRK